METRNTVNAYHKYKLLSIILVLAIAFATAASLVPANADSIPLVSMSASESGMVRVRLDSIGKPGSYTITVSGEYKAGSLDIASGSKVTVYPSGGGFTLSYGGSSYNMGSSFYLSRKGSGSVKISQALSPGNPYPADLRFVYISGSPYIVAHVYIEDYLPGVVGYEMSDNFPIESLKAQAISARTYAMRAASVNKAQAYDVKDTTSDQVYRGTPSGNANVKTAVSGTVGMTLMYNNAYCQVYYSSSNGGQTESNAHAWGGSALPYCPIVDDPYDIANPNSTVKKGTIYSNFASNSAAVKNLIASAAGTSDIGTIYDIELTSPKYNAPSKLYTKAVIYYTTSGGSNKTCTVNIFNGLNSALGISIGKLKNELHYVENISGGFRILARRYGHGVGMSQYGAQQMAKQGFDFLNILGFYYRGASLVKHAFSTASVPPAATTAPLDGSSGTLALDPFIGTGVAEGAKLASAYVVLEDANGRLNMRKSASANAAVLAKIPHGAKITVESADAKGWIKTSYSGATGYIMSKYVQINAPGAVQLPDPEKADNQGNTILTPVYQTGDNRASQKLGTGKVNMKSGNLNIRDIPSAKGKVLVKIPNGTSVDIYGTSSDWYEVFYKGVYGYASREFISMASASVPPAATPAPLGGSSGTLAVMQEGVGIIKTDSGEGNVYMRAKASSSATIRDRIPHNTVVAVLKTEGDWVRITYKGNTGYVKRDFITFN